jgi:hypothetical protein
MENPNEEEDTMRRTTLIVAVTIGLALLVAVPAVGMAAMSGSGSADQAANETAPGERLSAVVGVQEAEIEAGLEHRSFRIRLQQAGSQVEQADAVSEQVRDVGAQIGALEERKAELEAMLEDGEISLGRYRAEMAQIAAEIETLESLSNQSARAASDLPVELLEKRGVNTTAIRTLQERASELSGPEIAEIAQDIGGGPPEELGPPVNQTRGANNGTGPPGEGEGPPGDDPPGEDPPGDDPPGDDPPGDDPPGDDPPGEDPPGDDPPGDDPPGDDPPGDDPPGDDPPGDDPPGDDPPGDDPPGDDPPGDDPPGDDPPGEDPPGEDPPGDDPPGDDPPGDDPPGNDPPSDSVSGIQFSTLQA